MLKESVALKRKRVAIPTSWGLPCREAFSIFHARRTQPSPFSPLILSSLASATMASREERTAPSPPSSELQLVNMSSTLDRISARGSSPSSSSRRRLRSFAMIFCTKTPFADSWKRRTCRKRDIFFVCSCAFSSALDMFFFFVNKHMKIKCNRVPASLTAIDDVR